MHGNLSVRIRKIFAKHMQNVRTTRKVFVERISFAVVRYFVVVLQIRVMSSLDDHTRRVFSVFVRIRVFILQLVKGTSFQFVIV